MTTYERFMLAAGSMALFASCSGETGLDEPEDQIEVATAESQLVYGTDDRVEYGAASTKNQDWANSVAMLVNKAQVSCASGTCTLTRQNWTTDFFSKKRLCSGVRFRNQKTLAFGGTPPVGGFCTGFLVAPDLVVSAAHCLHEGLNHLDTRFVFGYRADAAGGSIPTTVPQDNVYSGVEETDFFLFTSPNWDWIVYKLDRPVVNRVPFPIRHSGSVGIGTKLVIIGYPMGLPEKISPTGSVMDVSDPFLFGHNVESFKGNSGSPVIDAQTGVVEGIEVLAAPNTPQFTDSTDASGPCVIETKCSSTSGCPGFSRSWRVAETSDFVPLTPAQITDLLQSAG